MSSLLPNGKQHFDDNNGRPLVGGRVYYYIPNTSTPKNTWQDEAQTILNTNPIILDGRGECTAWGYGSYRQVVRDWLGNLIWDRLVTDFTEKIDTAIEAVFDDLEGDTGTEKIGFLRNGNEGGSLMILRDFLSKQTPIYPAEKGGVGDGIADDTEAIRQCILSGRPINTGLDGEVWRLGTTLNVTLASDLSLLGYGSFLFDPTSVAQYGVFIEANGHSIRSQGAQQFNFQKKSYNGLYVSNNSDSFSYLDMSGLLLVENVQRSGTLFTGDAGITFNGKFDGSFSHVKVRDVSCSPAAAIPGVAGACGFLFRAISPTRAPRNISFGILDLDTVYKTSLADNVDQDGARLYAAEDTPGELRPYDTKYTIDLAIGRNCVGRTLKFQTDWATVGKATITREFQSGSYEGQLGGSEIDFQTGGGIANNVTANYKDGVPTTVTVFSGTVTANKLTPYGKASNYQISVGPGLTLDAVFRAGTRGTGTTVSFAANQVEVRGNLTVATQIQPPSGLVTTVYANMRDFFTAPTEALIRTTGGSATMYVNVSGCPNLGASEVRMLNKGSTAHDVYLNAPDSEVNWITYNRNVSGSTGPVARLSPVAGRDALYGPIKDYFTMQLEPGATWALPKIAQNGNTCKGSISVGRNGLTDAVDFVASSTGTLKNSPDTVGTAWTFGTTTNPGTGTFRIWSDIDHVYIYNGHTAALYFGVDLQG